MKLTDLHKEFTAYALLERCLEPTTVEWYNGTIFGVLSLVKVLEYGNLSGFNLIFSVWRGMMKTSKFKQEQKKTLLLKGYEAMQKESKDIMKDFKAIDAVFSERAEESSVSYENMLKRLKADGKI